MDFLLVCHQIAFQCKRSVEYITNLLLHTFMNAQNVSLKVFGAEEGLWTLITLPLSLCAVRLGHVPFQITGPAEFLLTLFALDVTLVMKSCGVTPEGLLRAVCTGTHVALILLDVIVPELLVGLKVPGVHVRLVTLVTLVPSCLDSAAKMHPLHVFPKLFLRLEFLRALITEKVVLVGVGTLDMPDKEIFLNETCRALFTLEPFFF